MASPYLFIGLYYDEDGQLVYDGARELRHFLAMHPWVSVEIVTNSLLNTDNFFNQAIIDMDMAPRLLLDEPLESKWIAGENGWDPAGLIYRGLHSLGLEYLM